MEKTDLSSVIQIRSGAAPVKSSLADEVLRRACKNSVFLEGYGLTEVCVICAFPHTLQPRGSVGILGCGLRVKVLTRISWVIFGCYR